MRSAERARAWTAVRDSPQREIQLNSFSFAGIPGIQDGTVRFNSPITAICGINGTGKSSLLRAIWATLKWTEIDNFPEIKERLQGLAAELRITIRGDSIVWNSPGVGSAAPPDTSVVHIDPSAAAAQLQRSVCKVNQLDEVLEPHAAMTVPQRELGLLSFILNKKYEAAQIYEIDDYPDHDPFPVIVVSEDGVQYDVRTMSLGEISVFTIFWALHRAEKNSIVLLEEPETFLSPVSQGAFLDYLANLCVQKQLTIVLTTHSPQMFARLEKSQVVFTYRTSQGAKVANEGQFDAMRRAVGLPTEIDCLLLVEDRIAREFTECILKKYDHSLLLRSEVVDVGGLGEVSRVCQTFPVRAKSFKTIAVYDGDSRTELSKTTIAWPAAMLPGDLPIEEEFRSVVEGDSEAFSLQRGYDRNEIDVVLAAIRGLDHHDWFEELAKELKISYSQLMHFCFELWCKPQRNEAYVDNFLFDLRLAVGA